MMAKITKEIENGILDPMISAIEFKNLGTKIDSSPFLQAEYKKYQAYLHAVVAEKGSSEREILAITKQKKYVEAVLSELVKNAEVLLNFSKIVNEHNSTLERVPKEYLGVIKEPSQASEATIFSSLFYVLNYLKDSNTDTNYLNKDTLTLTEKLFVDGLNTFKEEFLTNIEQLKARAVDSREYFEKIQEQQEQCTKRIHNLLEEHQLLLRTYRQHALIKAGTAVETQFVVSELTKELYKWISDFKRQCKAEVNSSAKRGTEEIESIHIAKSELQTTYQNMLRANMDDWKTTKEQRFRRKANLASWIEKIEKDSKNNQNQLEQLRSQIQDLKKVSEGLNGKINELDDVYLVVQKAFARDYDKFREKLLRKKLTTLQRWWRAIVLKNKGALQPISSGSRVKQGSKAKKGKKKDKKKLRKKGLN